MITPYGQSIYSGPNDGSGRGTITQTLSPAEQAKLDASQRIQQGSLGILESDLPNISKALSGDFGLSGSAISGYDPKYKIGDTQTQLGDAGAIQKALNFSGAPGMPDASDATRQAVTNALYQQGSQYLDPQFKDKSDALTAQLANQGITARKRGVRPSAAATVPAEPEGVLGSGEYCDVWWHRRYEQDVWHGDAGAAGRRRRDGGARTVRQLRAGTATQQPAGGPAGEQRGSGATSEHRRPIVAAADTKPGSKNYAEYAQNRTMPINMLNALLSSGQVNNPQFQPITPTSIAPPPIMQGVQMQGQANAAGQSANAAQSGQMMGTIGTIAGTALMVF